MPYWGVHSTTVVGYAYEAAMHCIPCAVARFPDIEDDTPYEDREGNPVTPVFVDDSYDPETRSYAACDTCHTALLPDN